MDELTRRVTERVLSRLQERPRALLIGKEPNEPLCYTYVKEAPYSAVILGSLSVYQLLFPPEEVLQALYEGKPVFLCQTGLPKDPGAPKLLQHRLREAEQQLYNWGAKPLCAPIKAGLITATEARRMRSLGQTAPKGSRLTPLAREILEGKES